MTKRPSRPKALPHARAMVFDMDGVLVKEDAALQFFQNLGLQDEFWRHRDLSNAAFYGTGRKKDVKRFRQDVDRIHHDLFPSATAEEHARHNHLYPGAVMKTLLHQLILQRRQAGDPLKEEEFRRIGCTVSLMPGAQNLIRFLRNHPKVRHRIYINTAAYQPIAEEVAARLGIPLRNVFGTRLDIDKEGNVRGMPGEANIMRFKRQPLRGILRLSRVHRRRMIAVGDSATDLDFLTAISIPGAGVVKKTDPETGNSTWLPASSRQGGIIIAHNPSADMLERIRRGGPLYGRGLTLSVFLQPLGEKQHPDLPNAVVAAAHRLDRLEPIFRAMLKSTDSREQSEALAQLVRKNQEGRTAPEQPIIAFAHRELDAGQAEQIRRIRVRARGEVAEKTRKD